MIPPEEDQYDPERTLWKPGRRSFLFMLGATLGAALVPVPAGRYTSETFGDHHTDAIALLLKQGLESMRRDTGMSRLVSAKRYSGHPSLNVQTGNSGLYQSLSI